MTTTTTTLRKTSKGQTAFARADVTDAIVNNDGTITFPLSSETPYRRYYWDHGELDEILSHDPSSVDLSWLKSGNAPLLDTHSHHELKNVIGRIIDAELRGKRIYVTAVLSDAEDDVSTVQKIRSGIIRNVSIGYEITQYTIDEDAGTYTATRWMPKEASFVPLPADPTVGIGRTADMKGKNMTTATNPDGGANTATLMPGLDKDTRSDEERASDLESNINEITALAATHNMSDVARGYIKGCVERGVEPSLAYFKGAVRSKLPANTPLVNTDIGLSDSERQSFSIMNLARHLQNPDGGHAEFELAACAAAAEKRERGSDGYALPTDLMRSWGNFTVDGVSYRSVRSGAITDSLRRMGVRVPVSAGAIGSPAAGGNPNILTVDHMAESFIDNLRNTSSILRAGVTTMDGLSSDVEIPGGDQNIQALWLASEDADAAESVPTFRKVTLSPKDVAAFTDITRRMLQQATIAIEAYVRMQLMEGHRIAIDHAGVYGSGATGVPLGVVNTTGIGSVTFATAGTPAYGELVDIETAVENTNRMGDVTHLISSTMRGEWRKTQVTPTAPTGKFIYDQFGDAAIKSNQILPADVVSGVWEDLVMGMWGGLDIARSTERKYLSGGVSLRSIQTVDFAATRVGSFVLGR